MILAFRPNGRTTFKSLQKVLNVSYMKALHQQIVKVDGSLESFIQRHPSIFNKVYHLLCVHTHQHLPLVDTVFPRCPYVCCVGVA